MKFCVIGLGRFGYQLSVTLAERNMEVMSIDSNEAIVASIRDKVTQAVCMRVTDEESLHAVGMEEMDTVIVAMGEDFAQSILITALLKKHLNIPVVIARAVSKIHDDILKLVGADQVVFPEKDLGIKFANKLSMPFIDLAHLTNKFAITEIKASKSFIGKTIYELKLKKSWNVVCFAKKEDTEIKLINADYVVMEDDLLIFAGEDKALASLARAE